MKRLVCMAMLALVLTTVAGGVGAQPEGTGRAPGYSEAVNIEEFGPPPEGAREDTVSAPLMVTLAYAFIWLLAAGFMWSIWRRSRALQSEVMAAHERLDALDRRLRSEGDGGKPGRGA